MSPPKVLVVGAGTIGMRTALELLRRNVPVVVRAPRHPLDPRTCSMGAAGLWMPVHSPDPRTDAWALATLHELWSLADEETTEQERPLAEKLTAVVLKREHSGPTVSDYSSGNQDLMKTVNRLPAWTSDSRLEFQHLTVEMLAWQNIAHRLRIPPEQELKEAGYLYAWMFRTVVIDAPRMLGYMLSQLTEQADIKIDASEEYDSLEEMVQRAVDLGCSTVVNCTGLGASRLCQDELLVGGRGVVLQYDRAKAIRRRDVLASPHGAHVNDAVIMTDEEPWASNIMPSYLIPRGDKIVVGGSMLKGDMESGLRDSERAQLLQNAHRLGIDTSSCKPADEWTGYRPYRPTIRLEIDQDYINFNVRVIHNYGHGGSGWSINAGCASECANLVTCESI